MRISSVQPGLGREKIPPSSWIHPALTLGVSEIDGQGVFATAPLEKSVPIIKWGGEIFTKEDVSLGRGRQHTLVGITEDLLLGNLKEQPPGLDDYMNHSCEPNVGMVDEITIITMRAIQAGEELVADYAIWLNDETYVMKRSCACKSQNCRKTIRGSDWRLPRVASKNNGYFSPFIARRIMSGA